MASGELPIKFQEHLQLSAVSVPDDAIGFTTCTLESDKYVWYVILSHCVYVLVAAVVVLKFIKLTLVIIVVASERLPQMVTWWPSSTSMIITL
jgi:hypothetical protein